MKYTFLILNKNKLIIICHRTCEVPIVGREERKEGMRGKRAYVDWRIFWRSFILDYVQFDMQLHLQKFFQSEKLKKKIREASFLDINFEK